MMIANPTLEDMIFRMWVRSIEQAGDYDSVPIEAVQKLISDTRKITAAAGWPATYTHDFFVDLRDILKRKTAGHPVTLQIIRLLEIETEFN